jgi:hypothetical protein
VKLPPDQVQEIDRPDVSETFADALGNGSFDGQTARLTFSVTRLDPITPARPPTAKRYPVCRLVLPPDAVVELFNQLQQLIGLMEQQGLVTREDGRPKTIN